MKYNGKILEIERLRPHKPYYKVVVHVIDEKLTEELCEKNAYYFEDKVIFFSASRLKKKYGIDSRIDKFLVGSKIQFQFYGIGERMFDNTFCNQNEKLIKSFSIDFSKRFLETSNKYKGLKYRVGDFVTFQYSYISNLTNESIHEDYGVISNLEFDEDDINNSFYEIENEFNRTHTVYFYSQYIEDHIIKNDECTITGILKDDDLITKVKERYKYIDIVDNSRERHYDDYFDGGGGNEWSDPSDCPGSHFC